MGSYRELRVWQQAMDFAVEVYRATEKFPKHELYGLTGQLRRAAVSIASNIAEGKGHKSDRDYSRFLFHARGSLYEAETQIALAARLGYLEEATGASLLNSATAIAGGLAGLINSMRPQAQSASAD
jgi:four helix bundle protein